MHNSIPFLFCILGLVTIPSLNADPAPGVYINCGAAKEETNNGIQWVTDNGFINTGNVSEINTPGIIPVLSTLRYFPDKSASKYCFEVNGISKRKRYLIRTTYYYGAFDGGKAPPVFDQIIDANKWSTVDTSDNFAEGLTSYYEIIVEAQRKTLSVCLARNEKTVSSPFISALEVIRLESSMYNATDFKSYALSSVVRHRFGHKEFLSYPDDPYNRYWLPFPTDPTRLVVDSLSNITSTDLWNIPPSNALSKGFTASKGNHLAINWPPMNLPSASYYIALYFHDNRNPSPYAWRVFDVKVNNQTFYDGLNVSTNGVMVYGKQWPLSGQTEIRMIPAANMDKGPLINAGEVFQIVPLGPRTFPREAVAMALLARGFQNPPSDWTGDPCLPEGHAWTGVTCTVFNGHLARIISLNLTNFGISGNISSFLFRLSAIQSIDLSNNKLTGPIPELTHLDELTTLHLNNNNLKGSIPPSLANLPKLKEVRLQNNQFEGQVPEALKNKPGIDISA